MDRIIEAGTLARVLHTLSLVILTSLSNRPKWSQRGQLRGCNEKAGGSWEYGRGSGERGRRIWLTLGGATDCFL
jgi:hypothetical protein